MISIARDTTRNVKRWRDDKTINRWRAAGMLNAEHRLRRRKGYRQMPRFVAALARHVEAVPPAWDAGGVAWVNEPPPTAQCRDWTLDAGGGLGPES